MRSDIRIRVKAAAGGQPQTFAADVRIPADLQLDPQARVYVEAYVGTSSMRFDFGTVAAVEAPGDCTLTEIDEGAPVLFRVRVVDEGQQLGRLLAAANGIRPEGDDDGNHRKSLLPVRSCDLGEEVWRVSIDGDAGPELAVNNRIPNIMERLQSDAVLTGLIYPEVVRQIARRVWDVDLGAGEDVEWLDDWRRWLEDQLGRPVVVDDSLDVEEVANDVARGFSAKHKFASAMASLTGEEMT